MGWDTVILEVPVHARRRQVSVRLWGPASSGQDASGRSCPPAPRCLLHADSQGSNICAHSHAPLLGGGCHCPLPFLLLKGHPFVPSSWGPCVGSCYLTSKAFHLEVNQCHLGR